MLERSGDAHPRRCGIVKALIGALWRIWDPPEDAQLGADDRGTEGNHRHIIGFTLIEVLMAIVILAALAGLALPNYRAYIDQAQYTTVLADLKAIEKDILAWAYKNDRYPDTLADVNRQAMRDPWDNPYQYLNVTTAAKNDPVRKNHADHPISDDFDLYSMGPDGKTKPALTSKHSKDDIIRADNGTFYGRVTEYY